MRAVVRACVCARARVCAHAGQKEWVSRLPGSGGLRNHIVCVIVPVPVRRKAVLAEAYPGRGAVCGFEGGREWRRVLPR